ncbi:ABC transporter permease [Paraburkholderia sp. D15]|uniref:ABC transporter permease n=1 Tax=Paraburkholderia sp. D15 TaxID=2880218 RepID=UPI002478AB9C|nr:ABC transporter permease [Paraburkholderia sp. D15]WGS48777.1 ABC transporter permease [Paraburkholderia sp. D15]WKF56664.1 Glutathione transport system permease protein GsiD [Paraburkholderia busanensis]
MRHSATMLAWRPDRDTTLGIVLRSLFGHPAVAAATSICLVLVAIALLAPWIAPQNPYDLAALNIVDGRLPPGARGVSGHLYLLGSDALGRDMFAAMMYGLRISLGVGVLSGVFAMSLGTTLGLVAAYFGGYVDTLVMRAVDLILGFPTILVALMMLAILGQGVDKVILALVVVQWAYFARTVRAVAAVERRKEYMEAAFCLGLSHRRALFSQLLPNCLPPVIVIALVQIAAAISAEATLSFLGIGLPVTQPSLGLLIANGYQQLIAGFYWISVFPGLLLLVLVFSMNIVGDSLREALNPRLRK